MKRIAKANNNPQHVYRIKITQRVHRILADNPDEVIAYLSTHLNNVCKITIEDPCGLYPPIESIEDLEHHTCIVTDSNKIIGY